VKYVNLKKSEITSNTIVRSVPILGQKQYLSYNIIGGLSAIY